MEKKVLKFQKYICGLKKKSGQLLINSQQKTGFLGLFLGLQTVVGLAKMLTVETPDTLTKIPLLLSYRLSQDHLELFFSVIRSRSGFNPNPTCRLFTVAFKGILMQAEIKIDSGNCAILQEKIVSASKYKIL